MKNRHILFALICWFLSGQVNAAWVDAQMLVGQNNGTAEAKHAAPIGSWVNPQSAANYIAENSVLFHRCDIQKISSYAYHYAVFCYYYRGHDRDTEWNQIPVRFSKQRCPDGARFDEGRLQCETPCEFGANPDGTCMDACQFKASVDALRKLKWHPYVYGELVTGACFGNVTSIRCEMERKDDTIFCSGVPNGEYGPDSRCEAHFAYTGSQCDTNELFWGDDSDTTDPDDPTDPTHDPDDPTGDIEDPDPLPDSDSEPVDPDAVDPEPDVEDPETNESTDTAVLEAIKGLNSDVNSAVHALNIDINQSQANITNELKALQSSQVDTAQAIQAQQKNDNSIYENTKALIQQANGDITTAVNKNTNAVKGLNQGIEAIGDGLGDITDLLSKTGFNTPTGSTMDAWVFDGDDFTQLTDRQQTQKELLERMSHEVRDMFKFGTDFNTGALGHQSFVIDGVVVESGLQRFAGVADKVRPVILFVCTLIALFVLFGKGSKS